MIDSRVLFTYKRRLSLNLSQCLANRREVIVEHGSLQPPSRVLTDTLVHVRKVHNKVVSMRAVPRNLSKRRPPDDNVGRVLGRPGNLAGLTSVGNCFFFIGLPTSYQVNSISNSLVSNITKLYSTQHSIIYVVICMFLRLGC
jgi:hypothetical protein